MASKEYVVDASAAATVVLQKDAVGDTVSHLLGTTVCHAPHLIDAEIGQVLRRHERGGDIDETAAAIGLRLLSTVIDHRYAHQGWLATKAWSLRHTITFYDALYVALAEQLQIPLLTADTKLSKAPGLSCDVELIS